jgi:hypothetical protein
VNHAGRAQAWPASSTSRRATEGRDERALRESEERFRLVADRAQGIPQEQFWSFTVYDNQTRSFLDTPQRYPRAGDQSYPSPAAEPDAEGSTTVYFPRHTLPASNVAIGSRPIRRKAWFTIPAPLQPAPGVLR